MNGPKNAALFAGLDVSTQSCKLVVIDFEAGCVIHQDRVDYDRDLPAYGTVGGVIPHLGEGVSESDPFMWIDAVDVVLGRLPSSGVDAASVRAISVSGQQHGLVALTSEGTLARPRSKLWNDVSTAGECGMLEEMVAGRPRMIEAVGNAQRPGYTASKILHLARHEPEAFARTHTFLLVHNFINWYLTGGAHGGVTVMEPGDASGTALWNPATGKWSQEVIGSIHPTLQEKLPPVEPSDRSIGTIAPDLARRFGMSADCRIDAGSGDNMYGAVGTGNIRPGIVTVSLGTSGTAYTFLNEPFIDPAGEIAAFADSTGHHLPLLCISNLANGYDAFLEANGLSHEAFDDLYLKSAPGSGGRVILPWFQGERTPDLPDAAPVYFGFGPSDFRPEILARALVEGHILSLFDSFKRLPVKPSEIRITGGLANSRAWRQGVADIFGTEAVRVLGEGAALGAALHAAWVWHREEGSERGLNEITDSFVMLDEDGRCRPTPEHSEVHDLLRRLFRSLSLRVRGLAGEDPFQLRKEILETGRSQTKRVGLEGPE